MKREVWSANEVTVGVWPEDADGVFDWARSTTYVYAAGDFTGGVFKYDFADAEFTTAADFTDAFGHKFSALQKVKISERYVPGLGHPNVKGVPMGFSLGLSVAHYSTLADFTQFTDPTEDWRVLISFSNPRYTGVAPLTNDDPLDFRGCIAVADMSGQDDDVNEIRLTFTAETRHT